MACLNSGLMPPPSFPHLPPEVVVEIVEDAAYNSTKTANTLASVSRWTRKIALEALYSVVVMKMIKRNEMELLHFTERASSLTAGPSGSCTPTKIWTAPFGKLMTVMRGFSPASHNDRLLLDAINIRSLWLEFTNHRVCYHPGHFAEVMDFLRIPSSLNSITHLAIDDEVYSEALTNGLSFPNVAHLTLLERNHDNRGTDLTAPIPLGNIYIRDTMRVGDMPLLTHLDVGVVPSNFLQVVASSDEFRDSDDSVINFINLRFPSVTHFAFTLYAIGEGRRIMEPFIRALLKFKGDNGGSKFERLIVCALENYDWWGLPGQYRYDDGSDQAEAAAKLVEKIDDPRVVFSLRHLPPWQDWDSLRRRGTDLWEDATNGKQMNSL